METNASIPSEQISDNSPQKSKYQVRESVNAEQKVKQSPKQKVNVIIEDEFPLGGNKQPMTGGTTAKIPSVPTGWV